MELHDGILAWKKHRMLIVIVTLIIILLTFLVSRYVLERQYESTATVIINRENATPDIIFERNLIKVFSSIAESDLVAKGVIDKLNLTYTVREVRELIQLDMDEDTGVIKIVVRTNNAQQSLKIVNAFIQSLGDQAKYFLNEIYIHTIDAPSLAEKPATPNLPINLGLALAGGLMGGCLLALILEYREQTRKQIQVINRLPYLFQIGVLPNRKGAHRWSRKKTINSSTPVLPDTGNEGHALRSIRTNLLYLMERNAIRTILITSPKAKEGKTFLSLNIALCFAKMGKRVLVVDCQFHKSKEEHAIPLAAQDQQIVNGIVVKPMQEEDHQASFDVLVPPGNENVDYQLLSAMLDTLRDAYDLVLLDGPPMSDSANLLMLSHFAPHTVLAADYRKLSFRILDQSTQSLTQIGANLLGVVVNFAPRVKME